MGTEVEGFVDLEMVGRGGFATVYRAREPALNRVVALKVFDVELLEDQASRFSVECQLIGELAELSAAIALVFAAGMSAGRPYLAMRYYPGGSAAGVIRSRQLSVGEAVDIGARLCDALHTAHSIGVLHRDIKPANVLLDASGRVVLSDFGIAVLDAGDYTTTSASLLTPAYAAPERLDGEGGSVRSDVYSLAATIWSLLSGRAPHANTAGDSIATVVRRVVAGQLSVLPRADVPQPLEAALRAALSLDPSARPADVREFASSVGWAEPARTRPSAMDFPTTPRATASPLSIETAPPRASGDPVDDGTVIRARTPVAVEAPENPTEPTVGGGRERRRRCLVAPVAALLSAGMVLAVVFAVSRGSNSARGSETDAESHVTSTTRATSASPVSTSLQSPDPVGGSSAPPVTTPADATSVVVPSVTTGSTRRVGRGTESGKSADSGSGTGATAGTASGTAGGSTAPPAATTQTTAAAPVATTPDTPSPTVTTAVAGRSRSEGDLTGDRKVGCADLAAVLEYWNTGDMRGDTNQDGSVTITDLNAVLNHWDGDGTSWSGIFPDGTPTTAAPCTA